MTRIGSVLVATSLVFLGAACGGDDDGGDRLSKAEFLKQGNAICASSNDKLEEAAGDVFSDESPDPEVLRTFLHDVALPGIKAEVAAVDALEPPAELADRVDDLLTEARAAIEVFKDAADSDDPESAFKGENPFAATNKIANELGLDDCADD